MKALVKRESKPGLWLEDVEMPTIGINDVLIEVLRTGICGTDVHIYKWDAWARKTVPVPLVVGHEFVGKIVELGSNVKDFKIGDIVSTRKSDMVELERKVESLSFQVVELQRQLKISGVPNPADNQNLDPDSYQEEE